MNDDNDIGVIQMDEMKRSIDMPLKIDSLYNMVTCDECGIGLPFEWILPSIRSVKSMTSRRAPTLERHGSDHHEKKRHELMYEELHELTYV